MDRLLVDLYLESQAPVPSRSCSTWTRPTSRFTAISRSGSPGYYDSYCYLPLYIFAGDQLLSARLRPANRDAAAGSLEEVGPIVTKVRQRWPETRSYSGRHRLCREELMNWCEPNRVDYPFGLARDQRLRGIIGKQMHQAQREHKDTAQAARVFTELTTRHARAGRARAAWSPRPSIWTRARTRASSSLR